MNRRSLIKSLAGLVAFVGAPHMAQAVAHGNMDSDSDHECGDYCFYSAESIARANIKETGDWKLTLHDWSSRRMIVTRCGTAACEVSLDGSQWQYKKRKLSTEERASFRVEYGRTHWMLLGDNVRGFVLNGRYNGWNLSVGPKP